MTQLHANELRPPCIVSSAEGVIGPITAEGIVEVAHSRFHAFGVPITPAWLERLGFVINLYCYSKILKYTPSEDILLYLRFEKGINDIDFFPSIMNVKCIVECKYIHQLQNLYFTLTGEELTID